MKIHTLLLGLVLMSLLTLTLASPAVAQQDESPNPEVPSTPRAVAELVEAVPFTLEEGERHYWRMERPMMTSGYLLVLKVDPEFVWPRQAANPVLYVGKQTAERFNRGHLDGHVVVFVPGNVTDPKAADYIDLNTARAWFGEPELPERVDEAEIERQHALAVQAGIRPFPASMLNRARVRGGVEVESFANKNALIQRAVDLVIRHAPSEVEFIQLHRPEFQPGG